MKNKMNKDVFAEVYAHTKKPITAAIAAEPELITRRNYANVKARRELKKPDIQEKIQKNLEKMSKNAIKRIDEMIHSDNEAIATQNSWKVVEHIRGTPTNKNLNVNAHLTIEDILE